MSRKNDGGSGPAHSSSDKSSGNLKGLRSQIDKLDTEILGLLNKRAVVAGQIGKIKSETGGEIFSAAREEEVLNHILSSNKGPLDVVTIRAIFRELISGSRAIQKVQKIAFLGPEYSYSHLAALERFGEASSYLRTATIAAVFEEVARKHADYGVVPLENSTDGRITDTLDMFIRMPNIKICAEIRLRVHHHLLANCQQTEVRRVYSKAQALSQCRNWLSKNLPHATLHEVSSTADAARLVQTEPNVAAVASRQAGVRYGIDTLYQNIEDSAFNETRFAVVGQSDSARTGTDKTALMFQTSNSPGALADSLMVFKQNKINLTWVESFPYREAKGEYVFFLEMEGHREDPKVKKSLAALENICETVSVLGSFPASQAASSPTIHRTFPYDDRTSVFVSHRVLNTKHSTLNTFPTMILVIRPDATLDQIEHVIERIKELGFTPHVSRGESRTIVGVIGDERKPQADNFSAIPGVEQVLAIMKPFKLASREFQKEDSAVYVGKVKVGGGSLAMIAGPCAVETYEVMDTVAKYVKAGGANILRGGAFKPRTSPYAFQGHGEDGLKILRDVGQKYDMPVVTEVMDPRQVELVVKYADMLQIGARNMQNFDLLKECGKTTTPVLLKRGMSATVKDLLMSAEYVLAEGNKDVVLCERGVRSFEDSTRNMLDMSAVPNVKGQSHLPIIVDPSHATGRPDLIPSMCRASVAAGADGVHVEVHNCPEKAMSDGPQALLPHQFLDLMADLKRLASALNREFWKPEEE